MPPVGADHPGGWRVQLARGAPARELAPAELSLTPTRPRTQATETVATALHGLWVPDRRARPGSWTWASSRARRSARRVYSDDPRARWPAYADARGARLSATERLFGAVAHFPGLGAARPPTQSGPASVGPGPGPSCASATCCPFRAAIDAGVPASGALARPLSDRNDFTQPASLTRSISPHWPAARGNSVSPGVAITDDLADPAITSSYSVADAAVAGDPGGRRPAVRVRVRRDDQQAAYQAVLSSRESGPRAVREPGSTRRCSGGGARERPSRTHGSCEM